MARESRSQFVPSWFSEPESKIGSADHRHRVRAYVRLWHAFMRARVFIAIVLLALQVFVLLTQSGGQAWLVGVCALHLGAVLVVMLWMQPIAPGKPFTVRWLLTIGVDLLAFGVLQSFQQGGINYTPLFALPVLLASILGSITLALATAAGVTLFLLADAALAATLSSAGSTSSLLQAGLTGTGFFLIALLSNQIAQRLAREEALAQSGQAAARTQAQVNELVIQNLSQGVMVVDRKGVVRNANPAAQNMLMGEHLSRSTRLLLSARSGWEGLSQLVEKTFAQGEGLEAETRIDMDNLPTRRFFVRTRLTGSRSGHPSELCVLFLEDLREVEARVRTEKLASMGRMSAAVAHEIRNPLSAITQANALLDEEVSLPGHKRLTLMIEQNARRLSRIVDDILNVARAQPSQGETMMALPLDAEVRQITLEWYRQQRARGALDVDLHAPDAHIGFDPEHLRRLLINLLDNALRHASGQPASIRVITRPQGGDRVRLSVWSDGAPLEASVLQHLFEPFFSSESRSSGLGLYLCRELCERYGAHIVYQRRRLDDRDGNEFQVLALIVAGTPNVAVQRNLPYPHAEAMQEPSRHTESLPSPPSLFTP